MYWYYYSSDAFHSYLYFGLFAIMCDRNISRSTSDMDIMHAVPATRLTFIVLIRTTLFYEFYIEESSCLYIRRNFADSVTAFTVWFLINVLITCPHKIYDWLVSVASNGAVSCLARHLQFCFIDDSSSLYTVLLTVRLNNHFDLPP